MHCVRRHLVTCLLLQVRTHVRDDTGADAPAFPVLSTRPWLF
jgi:hypothetical protein